LAFARAALLLGVVAAGGPGCASDVAGEDASSEDNLVATFDQTGNLDLAKPTRILLVGDSDKLSDLPLHSATSRARRYAQLYPNEQIVLFVTQDVKDTAVRKSGATVVTREAFGDGVAMQDLSRLSNDKLLKALDRFKKIASIDFFGHSSPFSILLEAKGDDRIVNANVPGSANLLADNFDRAGNAYVTLNGCNGGVELAAKLSKMWQVPVSGALTASDFQELRSDNHFYYNDDGFFPPDLRAATANSVSYGNGLSPKCGATGACVRMKPQDAPYYGYWSNQDTGMQYGLGFYKFFCDYADTNKSCQRGMAASMYSFVSEKPIDKTATDADYKEVLADFFCSHAKDPAWFDSCKAGLESAVETGAPFSSMKTRNDYSLECDFRSCKQVFRCETENGGPKPKTCAWVDKGCPVGAAYNSSKCFVKNTEKQTTRTEYLAYLEGHALLRSAAPASAPTCFSSTLRKDVAEKTCVQSKKDRNWYRCEAAGWTANPGQTDCVSKTALP
jgi:hypothetical protein